MLLRFKSKERLVLKGLVVFLVSGCAPPPVSELLKDGVTCKVEIELPDEELQRGEKVEVLARFTNCR